MAVAVAACGVVAAVAGLTAPLATAQDAETWTMGSYRNELLQRAINDVIANAGEQNVKFTFKDRDFNQVVYNYTNWVVCGQSPAPDKSVKVSAKPQTVWFSVGRPSTGC